MRTKRNRLLTISYPRFHQPRCLPFDIIMARYPQILLSNDPSSEPTNISSPQTIEANSQMHSIKRGFSLQRDYCWRNWMKQSTRWKNATPKGTRRKWGYPIFRKLEILVTATAIVQKMPFSSVQHVHSSFTQQHRRACSSNPFDLIASWMQMIICDSYWSKNSQDWLRKH